MANYPAGTVPVARQEALRAALPAAAELLRRCRAAEVGDDRIEDYVALNWLEWNGGALRLTVVGQNICRQVGINPG